ncbi:MAG: hypothetical protein IPP98_05390 [Gemmatimonadetes bacterium]|nr:hypothetical protein [Gemmatimonadota bacterium]
MTAFALTPRTLTAVLLLTVAAARPARAQEEVPRWQFRIASGSLLPTGAQRDAVKRAPMIAAQLSRGITPAIAVVSTIGWARSRDLATIDAARLDIFSADLGLEATASTRQISKTFSFTPIIGLGSGMRYYHHRHLAADATTTLGGYVAAGGEVGIGRVGVRLEVRDYLTNFTPLIAGGRSAVRNDVMLLGALRLKRR